MPHRNTHFYYKGDRIKPLRAFCQVARLGSVSRAAEALFISQPAVTLQLQALAREMGVTLLERSGRRLGLTREGELLYELARPLVTGLDGLALLRSDAADFAFGSMLDAPRDLDYAPVYRFDAMLIAPPDHPLATKPELRLEDLSPYGLILPPRRLTTYRLVDLVFQQNRVPYTVALEVGGWEVIKQYVAMGLGISIVTGFCLTEADRERLAIRDVSRYFPARSYGVVMRKGKFLSAQARAFINLVKPGLFERAGYDDPGHSAR